MKLWLNINFFLSNIIKKNDFLFIEKKTNNFKKKIEYVIPNAYQLVYQFKKIKIIIVTTSINTVRGTICLTISKK